MKAILENAPALAVVTGSVYHIVIDCLRYVNLGLWEILWGTATVIPALRSSQKNEKKVCLIASESPKDINNSNTAWRVISFDGLTVMSQEAVLLAQSSLSS